MFKRTIFGLVATSFIAFLVMSLPGCGGGGGGGGAAAGGAGGTATGLSLLAGYMGGDGNADGAAAYAGYHSPHGLATDSAGNMYVADTRNNTIRKITPTGVVSTLAGSAVAVGGAINGVGAAATFSLPHAVVADNAGNLYVADKNNNAIRKIVIATGAVSTYATGLNLPMGLAVDSAGNLYESNRGTNSINKIAPPVGGASAVVSVYATGLNMPTGLAIDGTGNLYEADKGTNSIKKIAAPVGGASAVVSAYATATAPQGLAMDSAGNLYEAGSNAIYKIAAPVGGASAVVSLLAGSSVAGNANGTGAAATFNNPFGVTTDSAGNVYVGDVRNNIIRKVTPAGVVSTFSGTLGRVFGHADGVGAAASFQKVYNVSTDSSGNIYVPDGWNNTIRKITPAGVVTTLAGSSVAIGSANGTGAAATFNRPVATAVDSAGNVYVSDKTNNLIRMITPAGVVSTYAASGVSVPKGLSFDATGNLYVVNKGTNSILRIAHPVGGASAVVSTFATGLNMPDGVAVNSAASKVYVTNKGSNTILAISASGVVGTLAGSSVAVAGSADGTGTAATFNMPHGIAIDPATGNLYVADRRNNTIRKITPAGVVTTVVGVAGRKGFVPGALPGALPAPLGLAVHGNTLYIAQRFGVAQVTPLP